MSIAMEVITTERFQLDRFLEVFPNAPVGSVAKKIHPDFVITNGNTSIGLELTQLFRTNKNSNYQPRQVEAFREQIVGSAKKSYVNKTNVPLDVSVLFSEVPLTNEAAIAQKLINTIETLASGNEPWRVVSRDDIDMPNELSLIKIIKRASHQGCSWNVTQTGWLPNIDELTIQAVISKKNKKLAQYKVCAKEIWLLLVMDQLYLSSSFNIPESVTQHIYASVFDKTVLFSCIDKRYWALKTTTLNDKVQNG